MQNYVAMVGSGASQIKKLCDSCRRYLDHLDGKNKILILQDGRHYLEDLVAFYSLVVNPVEPRRMSHSSTAPVAAGLPRSCSSASAAYAEAAILRSQEQPRPLPVRRDLLLFRVKLFGGWIRAFQGPLSFVSFPLWSQVCPMIQTMLSILYSTFHQDQQLSSMSFF